MPRQIARLAGEGSSSTSMRDLFDLWEAADKPEPTENRYAEGTPEAEQWNSLDARLQRIEREWLRVQSAKEWEKERTKPYWTGENPPLVIPGPKATKKERRRYSERAVERHREEQDEMRRKRRQAGMTPEQKREDGDLYLREVIAPLEDAAEADFEKKAAKKAKKKDRKLAKLRMKWRAELVAIYGEPAPAPPSASIAPRPLAADPGNVVSITAARGPESGQAPKKKKRRPASFSTTTYLD